MMWQWVRLGGTLKAGMRGWRLHLVTVANCEAADRSIGSASARAAGCARRSYTEATRRDPGMSSTAYEYAPSANDSVDRSVASSQRQVRQQNAYRGFQEWWHICRRFTTS